MNKRIFLAGASGAVGQPLCKLLVADGWQVIGTTRTATKANLLRKLGVQPVVVDVFDEDRLNRAVDEAAPDVVIHQLTDLPDGLNPHLMPEFLVRNSHLREVGTRNLLNAAVGAGVRRFIAQSIAFVYATGDQPFTEESPLDLNTSNASGLTIRGVASLEQQVLNSPLDGLVLRYGKFYGPETGFELPAADCPVHVEAAAEAARLALTHGQSGIYNISEELGYVSSRKARQELTWNPAFRIS